MNPRKFFLGRAIGFVVLLALIGVGFLAYKLFSNNKTGDSDVFCTMEALQCPDGSYVGRSGPKCEFTKCPDKSSFTGTLRQTSSGFDMILPSPENGGMEVSYVIPLNLKVSNVVGQIIGKKVEVFGSFSTGNTLDVDRLEELKDSDPTLGEVGVGKTVFINGVKITLNEVVQDSRCPVDAQCIEGGAINTNVTLQSNTDKETRNMPSDEVPISFDSYKISIEKINPPRFSNSEPLPDSYVILFKVVSN